jgi:hypothetical protein
MNDLGNDPTHNIKPRNRKLRVAIATVIAVMVASYTVAVLTGAIASVRQLSAADVILLVLVGGLIAVILRPEILKDVSSLSWAGVRIDLRHVQERQQEIQGSKTFWTRFSPCCSLLMCSSI